MGPLREVLEYYSSVDMGKERNPLMLEMFIHLGQKPASRSGKGGTWEVFREVTVAPCPLRAP